jgi:glucosamine kinase
VKSQILIGESGGSKTDWALLDGGEIVWQMSTDSLHPNQWNTDLFNELLYDFVERQVNFIETALVFFGAGCNREEKADLIKKYFSLFGFASVEIAGDLTAAGLATLGKSTGFVAILGSGSVLIDFQKGKVHQFYGGVGREKGDEGSGYYFGKLVLEGFATNSLEPIQQSILKAVLSFSEEAQLKRNEVKDELCLKIAQLLSSNLFEFQNFHFQNIDLFFTNYVTEHLPTDSEIQFVGSYAFFHQEIIKSYCQSKGYKTGQFVARPLKNLIPFYQTEFL